MRTMMRGTEPEDAEHEFPADIRKTTAYADLVSLVEEREALQLELRDPHGNVVETDDVHIDDTEWKMSLVSKKDRRRIEREFGPEPWEPHPEPFTRYQLQVRLRGVPRRRLHVPGLDD